VSAQQQIFATVVNSPTSLTGAPRGPEQRVAALVGDVVAQLETPSVGEPLHQMVAECNAILERCLEAHREVRDREDLAMSAKDELKRLARLLTVVDRADTFVIMRQIRRVLGRFDTCTA